MITFLSCGEKRVINHTAWECERNGLDKTLGSHDRQGDEGERVISVSCGLRTAIDIGKKKGEADHGGEGPD